MQALCAPGLTPGARVVLAIMADRATDTGCLYFERRDVLAVKAGLHPKTIQSRLRELQRLGYVSEEAHAQPGRTRTIRLHPEHWTRSAESK